ncbi:MAG: dehydrogenase, partial [Thaumarchaeota archaeon]
MKIIVTGSEGLLGKEISQYLEKKNEVIKVDLQLGHELTNEEFVKEFFKENKADSLVNCFAFNDHVKKGEKRGTIFNLTLESFNEFLEVNLTALFSVCRQYAQNNEMGSIVNFSATTGIVSARPDI